MIRRDERSRGESDGRRPVERPALAEDLAFLLVAVLVVALPVWIRSTPRGSLERREAAAQPLQILVNRAPWYEWTLLEGIGEARARALVRYREDHGPFRTREDLERVPHMPAGWVERAGEHLEFDD
jgi:competence ComEA-like helix-hairpin-helix protein